MKKIIYAAAVALAVFVGLTGCPSPTGSGEPAVTYSQWWIKGSFDDWKDNPKHYFVVDELDSNKLTFTITGLYNDPNVPLFYEFVLVNPNGKEYKYNSDTQVTPGTAFVLGDSSVSGSQFVKNVLFEATKASYTVTVDITNPAAPSVNLLAGSVDATPVTDEVLLNRLQIKGNQFSQINGTAVVAWSPANGTIDVDAKTVSWDVLVDNKNGEFGFNSLNNFLKGVYPDVASLSVGDSTTAEILSNTDGSNCKLVNPPKNGSIYTITITVDTTKSVTDGRYKMSVKLKTLGTEDWAFEVPANVYIVGDITGLGWDNNGSPILHGPIQFNNGIATYSYTATSTNNVAFKFAYSATAGWADVIGLSQIEIGTNSISLTDGGYGNIQFAVTSGKNYSISIDFSTSYTSTGKPVVTVIENN